MLADEKILFRKIFKRALLPSFTLYRALRAVVSFHSTIDWSRKSATWFSVIEHPTSRPTEKHAGPRCIAVYVSGRGGEAVEIWLSHDSNTK